MIPRLLIEDQIGQHEPTWTQKAEQMARRRVRQETGSPGIAEGSEDCSIEISGEEHGSGGILVPNSFNPNHDDSTRKEGVTRNQNPATSSNSGVWVKKERAQCLCATIIGHTCTP